MNNLKPNFLPNGPPLANTHNKRLEAGAIWERTSKKSQCKFLSMKIKLPKAKLLEIINNNTNEEVSLSFVAFPNDSYKGNENRPMFRIYEDKE